MKTALALLFTLCSSAVLAPGVQDEAPRFLEGAERERFLDQLEQRMSARKTIAAEFEQEKVLSLFDDTLKTRGAILFAAPDKLRWETQWEIEWNIGGLPIRRPIGTPWTATLREILADNPDLGLDEIRALVGLPRGGSITLGGGAAAAVIVTRL